MRIIIFLLVLTGLFGCDPNRVYEVNKDLDTYWQKDSVVNFEFELATGGIPVNIYTNVRNAVSYPFYNLYYQYTLKDSTGGILEEELQNINLFDPKTGEPYGSGLGDLFDHKQLILENYQLPDTGPYTLSLQHYMRLDSLPLILSVGVRVERTVSN